MAEINGWTEASRIRYLIYHEIKCDFLKIFEQSVLHIVSIFNKGRISTRFFRKKKILHQLNDRTIRKTRWRFLPFVLWVLFLASSDRWPRRVLWRRWLGRFWWGRRWERWNWSPSPFCWRRGLSHLSARLIKKIQISSHFEEIACLLRSRHYKSDKTWPNLSPDSRRRKVYLTLWCQQFNSCRLHLCPLWLGYYVL